MRSPRLFLMAGGTSLEGLQAGDVALLDSSVPRLSAGRPLVVHDSGTLESTANIKRERGIVPGSYDELLSYAYMSGVFHLQVLDAGTHSWAAPLRTNRRLVVRDTATLSSSSPTARAARPLQVADISTSRHAAGLGQKLLTVNDTSSSSHSVALRRHGSLAAADQASGSSTALLSGSFPLSAADASTGVATLAIKAAKRLSAHDESELVSTADLHRVGITGGAFFHRTQVRDQRG